MKTYMISYDRKAQVADYEQGLTDAEDRRTYELFREGIMDRFYMDKKHEQAWMVVKLSSKLEVLEFIASLRLSHPEKVEHFELHT